MKIFVYTFLLMVALVGFAFRVNDSIDTITPSKNIVTKSRRLKVLVQRVVFYRSENFINQNREMFFFFFIGSPMALSRGT